MSKIIDDQFEIENNVLIKYHEKEGITEVVVPSNITKIGKRAFLYCQTLTSITLPDSITSIELEAFCYCDNLININIPDNVNYIEEGAFFNCESLKNINISNNVQFIGDSAFAYCTNLKNITFSYGIKYIADNTFYCCENLTSITIPDSVKTIENGFDSRYIKEINLYSYRVFSLLNTDLKLIALISTLKNYYTGKIKYSEEDIKLFKEYIINTSFNDLEKYKELIRIIIYDIGIFLTKEEANILINKSSDTQIKAMLLEYINKYFNNDNKNNIGSIIDDKLNLDDGKIK